MSCKIVCDVTIANYVNLDSMFVKVARTPSGTALVPTDAKSASPGSSFEYYVYMNVFDFERPEPMPMFFSNNAMVSLLGKTASEVLATSAASLLDSLIKQTVRVIILVSIFDGGRACHVIDARRL